MDLAAQQLLLALRANRSQLAWARRLGYRSNPITDWENGRSYPTAEEALRVAEKAGVDVLRAFASFDGNVPLTRSEGVFDVSAWVQHLCAGKRIAELAASMGRSRSSVSRWLSGKARPRLPEFLELVDAATGRVPDLVAALVPIEQVPALLPRYQSSQAAKRLAFDAPWTEAILRLLETTDYRALPTHDDDWIARVLSIPQTVCGASIAQLKQAGLVRWTGSHYEPEALNVDTRGGKEALRALKKHWALVAAERAGTPQPDDAMAYNVLSVSEADLLRIRELLAGTFREIRAIVHASEPAQRVALLNLHLVAWSPPRAEEGGAR